MGKGKRIVECYRQLLWLSSHPTSVGNIIHKTINFCLLSNFEHRDFFLSIKSFLCNWLLCIHLYFSLQRKVLYTHTHSWLGFKLTNLASNNINLFSKKRLFVCYCYDGWEKVSWKTACLWMSAQGHAYFSDSFFQYKTYKSTKKNFWVGLMVSELLCKWMCFCLVSFKVCEWCLLY